MINWDLVTKEDATIIHQIAKRASAVGGDLTDVTMDVTATHNNGNPLKLQELLDADNLDFNHDIIGINKNIDRDTGKLQNCFLPRFSANK